MAENLVNHPASYDLLIQRGERCPTRCPVSLNALYDLFGARELRRRLLSLASGRVLEVAVGTGSNLPYYRPDCQITAVDIDPQALSAAGRQAARLGLQPAFRLMDAHWLDFPERSFDTVVSTFGLCAFSDPVAALREMARVCRADGLILLLDHGRSDTAWIAGLQDMLAGSWSAYLGRHWNHDLTLLLRQAGLIPLANHSAFGGLLRALEATPLIYKTKPGSVGR
jgi:SAM-dependent methyltransferase